MPVVLSPTRYDFINARGAWNRGESLLDQVSLFVTFFLTPLPPLTRGVVIGIGSFLRRPLCFGYMTQIDPDAGPGRRSASHGVDQHVVGGEESGYLGIFALPSFQSHQCGGFVGRIRNNNKRHLLSWRRLRC